MIVDARALDDDHVPELVHRDSEVDHLVSLLKPVSAGGIPHDVLITGPSGTGKSSTTRYVLDELDREALDVQVAYADAISHSAPTQILDALLRDMNRGYDLSGSNAAKSDYLQRIRSIDDSLVLTIDEIDVLDDKSVLAALYEIPDVHLVGICVSEDHLFCDLDIRVEDRLRNFKHVSFDYYSFHEIQDIVESRSKVAFAGRDAVTRDSLASIARTASGNARLAIGTLREAASEAQLHSTWPITDDLVCEVAAEAEREVATRYVEKLGTHQRVLFEIIREHGSIAAGELHAVYEERVTEVKSRSSRRNYLAALQREELVEKSGSTKDTRYEYVGP
jgi:cell division control protein 6